MTRSRAVLVTGVFGIAWVAACGSDNGTGQPPGGGDDAGADGGAFDDGGLDFETGMGDGGGNIRCDEACPTGLVCNHGFCEPPQGQCVSNAGCEYDSYCDSSGPLEQKPWSVYAISPTPKDWSDKRAQSFYREYNASMLAELTVHEAMPGHYLQAMHANKGKSDLRAVFSSGPFVEGWAVYGEWLMAKYGFGGPRVRMQRQKMTLRLAANAILDHDIHAGKMTEKEALALMTDEAFQEEGEAVGKWNRARLSSGQLTTYYYGFTELLKLRMQLEKAPGFTERAYHDKLLGFGSPSIRHIRALMTKGL